MSTIHWQEVLLVMGSYIFTLQNPAEKMLYVLLFRQNTLIGLDAGHLTNAEAIRLYFGTQLTPSQDDPITNEENDHRTFFDGLDDLDDHPF